MYVSLDGGGGGEACPSLADSAAVSLSQMAFLSMSVSIFSVGELFHYTLHKLFGMYRRIQKYFLHLTEDYWHQFKTHFLCFL